MNSCSSVAECSCSPHAFLLSATSRLCSISCLANKNALSLTWVCPSWEIASMLSLTSARLAGIAESRLGRAVKRRKLEFQMKATIRVCRAVLENGFTSLGPRRQFTSVTILYHIGQAGFDTVTSLTLFE